jgi:hypothetical protein
VRGIQTDYEAQVDTWYKTERDKNKDLQTKLIEAEANGARSREALLAAQRQGLIDLAKIQGFKPEELEAPKPPTPLKGEFDAEKYTNEVLVPMAQKEGRAIAKMAMLQNEHARLGLPADVDWVGIYDESQATGFKRSIEEIWMNRYKVPDARAAQAKAQQDAHDKKIADDAVTAARTAWVSEYGNPNTRPPMPSTHPFTPRKAEDGLRAKQPWEHADSKLSNDRVERATKKLVESTFGTH